MWLRDGSTDITLLNVEHSSVNIADEGSLLTVRNFLDVEVIGRIGPIEGVDVEVTDFLTSEIVYATSFYGGSDKQTDADGKVRGIQALLSQTDSNGKTISQVKIRINDHGLYKTERYIYVDVSKTETIIKKAITVDTQGNGDFPAIQDAIDASVEGDTILVEDGRYTENLVVDRSVAIYGIGTNVTLDATGGTGVLTNAPLTLSNFTITNSSIDLDVENTTLVYNVNYSSVDLSPDFYFGVGYYLTIRTVDDKLDPVPGSGLTMNTSIGFNRQFTSDPDGFVRDIPTLSYLDTSSQHLPVNPHEITATKGFRSGNHSLVIEQNMELVLGLTRHGAFGSAVLQADVNHDGHPDYIVGAPLDDESGIDAGALFIFYGPLEDTEVLRPIDADVVINGERMQNRFGSTLSVGDLDGDDLDDLIVGAPHYNNTEINGILGQYYNGHDFTNWQYSRVDGSINFPWGNGAPPIVGDEFAATWAGFLFIREEDDYTFYFEFDDGVRLILDGNTVIEQMSNTGREISTDGPIHLTPGFHSIEIHFREFGGAAKLVLKWETPTMPKTIIPRDVYFLTDQIDRGNGAVYVFSGELFQSGSPTIADGTRLDGDFPDFGYHLSTGDMNKDGKDDLLVGYAGGTRMYHGRSLIEHEPFMELPLLGSEWDPVVNGSGGSLSLSGSGSLAIEGTGAAYAYAMSKDLFEHGIRFRVTLEKGANTRFLDGIRYKVPREDVTNLSKQDDNTIFSLRANGEVIYWTSPGGDTTIIPSNVGIAFTYEVFISETMDRLSVLIDGKLVVDTPLTGWGSFYLKFGDSTKFGAPVNVLDFSPDLHSSDITGWGNAVYLDNGDGLVAASMFGESMLFSPDLDSYFEYQAVDQDDFSGIHNYTMFEDGLVLFPYRNLGLVPNGDFENDWADWTYVTNSQGQKKAGKRLVSSRTGDWDVSPYSGGPTGGFGSDGNVLDGLGGKSTGRLRSGAFLIGDEVDAITLWYHWKVISFDGSQGEGMNIKIHRASDHAVLMTVENWMSTYDSQAYETDDFVIRSLEDLKGETVYLAMETLGGDGGYDDGLAQIDDVDAVEKNDDLAGDYTSEFLDLGRSFTAFVPDWSMEEHSGNITFYYRTNESDDWVPVIEGLNLLEEKGSGFQYRVVFEGASDRSPPILTRLHFNFHESSPIDLQPGWPVIIDGFVDDHTLGIVNGSILTLYSGITPVMNITSDAEILTVDSPIDVDISGTSDLILSSDDQVFLFLANGLEDKHTSDADYNFSGEEGFGNALHHPMAGSPLERDEDGRTYILPLYQQNLALIGMNFIDGQLVYPSESIHLEPQVKNIGLVRMDNVRLTLLISAPSYSHNETIMISLDPGEYSDVQFQWDVPANERVAYEITFTLDPDMHPSNDRLELVLISRHHGLTLSTLKQYDAVAVNGTARYEVRLLNTGTLGADNATFEMAIPDGWDWWLSQEGVNFSSILVTDEVEFSVHVRTESTLGEYPISLTAYSDGGTINTTFQLSCHIVDRDLSPTSVHFLREDGNRGTPVHGENTTVVLEVKNFGTQDSGPFLTSLIVDGELIDEQLKENIQAGSNDTISFSIELTEGSHTVLFTVDVMDDVREYDELNNVISIVPVVKPEITSDPYQFRVHVTDLTHQDFPNINVRVSLASNSIENVTDQNGTTIIDLDSYPEGSEYLVEAIAGDLYASERIRVYSEDKQGIVELVVGTFSMDLNSDQFDTYIMPDGDQFFIINVTNTGDFDDEFGIRLDGLPALWDSGMQGKDFENGTIPIGKDETVPVRIDITSWKFAPAHYRYEMELTVSSMTSPFAVETVVLRTTVLPLENITIHTDQPDEHGLPGDPISHRIQVTNHGNTVRTMYLTVTGDTEFSSLNIDEVLLQPGDVKEVLFVITIPNLRDDTILDHELIGIVSGVGPTSPIHFTTLIDRTSGQYFAVEVEVDELIITNKGNHLENISISCTSDLAEITVFPEYVLIDLEESLHVSMVIRMTDLGIPSGTLISANISIRNEDDYYYNRSILISVPEVEGISLSADDTFLSVPPGTFAEFTILVTNTGNMDEEIFFSGTNSGPEPLLLPSSITLPRNGQRYVTLRIQLPEDADEDRHISFTGITGTTNLTLDLVLSPSVQRGLRLDEISVRTTGEGTRYTINLYNNGSVSERVRLETNCGELDLGIAEVDASDYIQFHVYVPFGLHCTEIILVNASSLVDTLLTTSLELTSPPFVTIQILSDLPSTTNDPVILKASGSYASYSWQIESRSVLGREIYYNFSHPGRYPITLTVEDERDVYSIFVTEIVIQNQHPRIDVQPILFGNTNEFVQFDARDSMDPDGAIINFTWYIDDQIQQGPNVFHAFETEGVYGVTLIITDDHGATNSTEFQLTIRDPAIAQTGGGTEKVELNMQILALSLVILIVMVGILVYLHHNLDFEENFLLEKIARMRDGTADAKDGFQGKGQTQYDDGEVGK